MRISLLALAAPVMALTFSWNAPRATAQETLGSVGAASGMGATLGSSSAGGMRPRTSGIGGGGGVVDEGMSDPSFPGSVSGGGAIGAPAGAGGGGRALPPLARQPGSGNAILGQLLAPPFRPTPENVRRSPRGQAAYSRRTTRMTPTERKKMVLRKYKIAPRGYLASYLPADRYKFAKSWKYVSTETDRFYYRPQDMARRRFNANRVIGFRTWQDAMLAGYRPDPVSKPEPGNQLAFLATMTRDEPLITTIEYAYAGQISPSVLTSTYNYVRQVKAVIDRHPQARQYQRETVNAILTAALTGDRSLIPKVFGQPAIPPAAIGAGSAEGDIGMEGVPAAPGTSSVAPMRPPAAAAVAPMAPSAGGGRPRVMAAQ
jgi:hypothetical protein